jgi:hypothetical protein
MSLLRNLLPFPVARSNQTLVTRSEAQDQNGPMVATKDSGGRLPARVQE